LHFPRYLINFDSKKLKKETFDVIIIGSGIAGVYTALCLPQNLNVAILTKEEINISNSVLAQGGIAVSLGKGDSPELHFQDTIAAGAGLCKEDVVRFLVNNAEDNINQLCTYGVRFDKEGKGNLSLSREAAHSKDRIVHVGDATGKEVCDTLIKEVHKKNNISIIEKVTVIDILAAGDTCAGILAMYQGEPIIFQSRVVICAAGGYGRIYRSTTNPEVATGDGASMAFRMGVELMDMEFVQFHPTVLFHRKNKTFLISEAVRGAGALLRNVNGERFMPDYHPMAELAPRDIVSRAIFSELEKTNSDHVYIDITFKDREFLKTRFPNIFAKCLEYGIDMSKQLVPVAPSEHYCMGGIRTDAFGRTKIKGFFSCGEAACNGIHGANRLASNSLLEGLVFGRNIAGQITELYKAGREINFEEAYDIPRKAAEIDAEAIMEDIRRTMDKYAGIVRTKEGLKKARDKIKKYIGEVIDIENLTHEHIEMQNMVLVSWVVVNSALMREESRGAHFRSDFPQIDDTRWKKNVIVSKEDWQDE